MLFLGKNYKKYIRIPIGIGLLLAFQVLSLIVKDVGIKTLGSYLVTDIIFSIDILIMEILYFSYSNLSKGGIKNG
jgi:hypothetical protein